MVADMLAGRITEVDQLNGEISRLGELCHVATPVNDQITRMVQAREGRTPAAFLSPAELRQSLTAVG